MAAIKGKNTRPEIVVRTVLHSLGYRFRLHKANLPGRPDIVMPKYRTAIFVNGCFWHCHECRFGKVIPATRSEFWADKRRGTVERDARKRGELELAGWRVITIWECETRSTEDLRSKLVSLLGLR